MIIICLFTTRRIVYYTAFQYKVIPSADVPNIPILENAICMGYMENISVDVTVDTMSCYVHTHTQYVVFRISTVKNLLILLYSVPLKALKSSCHTVFRNKAI